MRHPFWLVNSTLLLYFILTVLFVFFSWQGMPTKVSFEPSPEVKPIKKAIAKIDLSKIYTNDLFNTYVQPLPPVKEPDYTKPMPQPPIPKPVSIPSTPPIKFLEPLKITLRGIIVSSNEQANIAIIEDTKAGKAKNYKIGDMLEDAQLIRILKNKIILIRSNGQQETLYVSQHDAELEQILMPEQNWTTIVKKLEENSYSIDPDLFVEKLRTLAQFIDMLNLTTVYQQGVSMGCRVGKLEKNSFGLALGLMHGDIIQLINNTSIAETEQRFKIYKDILENHVEQDVTVSLLRNDQKVVITYKLKKVSPETAVSTSTELQPTPSKPDEKTSEYLEREKKKVLEQKYHFAPTVEELQKKEKKDMLNLSKNNRLVRRPGQGALLNNVNP